MPTHRTTNELDSRLESYIVSRNKLDKHSWGITFCEALDELLKEVGY